MTTKQRNRLSMFLMMQECCTNLLPVLGQLPMFTGLFTGFKETLDSILKLLEEQEVDYRGKAISKQEQKAKLAALTSEIIRRVRAYAEVNDLFELKAEINYCPSVLRKLSDHPLQAVCSIVNNRASELPEEFADYGVTQVMLDEQKAANNAFGELIPLPRTGIINRKNATTALDSAFKQATRILKKMDSIAGMTETSHLEVFWKYRFARRVVNSRGRGKESSHVIEGRAIDLKNGLPLSGVSVAVAGSTLVEMTGLDGRFEIAVDKAGDYRIRCEKADYGVLIREVKLNGKAEEVVLGMELVIGD